MALQIHFTQDPKLNCPLSYKIYELSKQLFNSYTWDKIEEKDNKIFYYCGDLVVERNKDFPLYVCDERVFLNYEKYIILKFNHYNSGINTIDKYWFDFKKSYKRVFYT